jgi:hypothetical protein
MFLTPLAGQRLAATVRLGCCAAQLELSLEARAPLPAFTIRHGPGRRRGLRCRPVAGCTPSSSSVRAVCSSGGGGSLNWPIGLSPNGVAGAGGALSARGERGLGVPGHIRQHEGGRRLPELRGRAGARMPGLREPGPRPGLARGGR